jgi:hypothetical protein
MNLDMHDKYEESSVSEKKQIFKYIFEEIKKNQNYEVDFEVNGLKKFAGNVVSDKEVFIGAMKYQFSLSRSLLESICDELVLSKKEVQEVFTLLKRDVEPVLNKWFNEKAINISGEEGLKYDTFNIDVEESSNQVLDKSAVENQIVNLVYMLGEYYETIHHYDRDHAMHIEYFFAEHDLFKFVREFVSTALPYEDFIKQLQTMEFSIEELEEPVVIFGDKEYIEEKNAFYFKVNNKIINALKEEEDDEEDDESFGSLF